METAGHDIGWAVAQMKEGLCVQRAGWNGKDMFLFIFKGSESYAYLNMVACKFASPEVQNNLPAIATLKSQDFVVMKTAQNSVVPWLCSQSDLLASDWQSYDAVMGY